MTDSAPRLFGTDGIRGPFGEFPLDRPTVTALGQRLVEQLRTNGRQPLVVLGGDTRSSTPVLAEWLAAGIEVAGGRWRWAGTVPTPAVAVLTRTLDADLGIALSASHNLPPDNGIKLFDAEGFKWSRAAEERIEERLATAEHSASRSEPERSPLDVDQDLARGYRRYLRAALPEGTPLAGLGIVIDAANGAATPFAETIFRSLGAEVEMLGDQPDGENINRDCGSTRPGRLIERLRATESDLGVAFDGDADRVVLVDETGALQDGDAILYLWAVELERQGVLDPPAIVATTMSNLGLERALEAEEIDVVRCDVGDREVVETMRRDGILLGGEQSGHIVHLGAATTGDGMLTALAMAKLLADCDESLSEMAAAVERFPQVLVNVRVARRVAFDTLPSVAAKARTIADRLGDEGRLLLRYSGTEPLARVMIEGRSQEEIERLADELAREIGDVLGEDAPPLEETAEEPAR